MQQLTTKEHPLRAVSTGMLDLRHKAICSGLACVSVVALRCQQEYI